MGDIVIALGGGLVPLGACLLAFGLGGHLLRYLLARRQLGANVLKRRYFDRALVRPFRGACQGGWPSTKLPPLSSAKSTTSSWASSLACARLGIYAVGLEARQPHEEPDVCGSGDLLSGSIPARGGR